MSWEPLTLETQRATQARIEAVLGLTREVWRSSSYLPQDESGTFTNARPAERMTILRSVIGGLDIYEAAHAHAKRLLGDVRAELGELGGRSALLAEAIRELPAVREREEALAGDIADAELSYTEAEREREEAAAALTQAQAQIAALEGLQTRRDVLEHRLDTLEQQERVADEATAKLAAEDARLPALETTAALEGEREALVVALRGYEEALGKRVDLFESADEAQATAFDLQDQMRADEAAGPEGSRCRECGQLLGEEALRASLAFRQAEVAELLAECDRYLAEANAIELPKLDGTKDLASAELALAEARQATLDLATTRERIIGLRQQRALLGLGSFYEKLDRLRAETKAAQAAYANALEASSVGVSGPQRRLVAVGALLSDLDIKLKALRREHAHAEQQRQTLEEQAARLRTLAAECERVAGEEHLLVQVAEMFHPATGIPLLLVENAVPLIEQRAQEVLERLGGQTAGSLIELQTQRTIKSGESRDTLDIVIHDPSGTPVPYEQWSGGERMRLDLSLRIGLAQLLLTRAGGVETFCVDEPAGLDAQGRAALAEVVEEMGERYGFRKVLLISHDESLRDAFAQTLEVTRPDGGWSEVES